MDGFRLIPDWLKRLLTTPTQELTRWQYAARFFIELCRHSARQLRDHRAGQMAAALAFRTIFGIVPVVAMVLVFVRGLKGLSGFQADDFRRFVENLLAAVKLDRISISSDGSDSSLVGMITDLVVQVNDNISFKSIGAVGTALLVWAAIGLLTTTERSFNTICHAPSHRPLNRRVPLYWITITLGPALLYVGFFINGRIDLLVMQLEWGATFVSLCGSAMSFCSAWLFLILLYTLMPNTRVGLKAASFGGFVAALLWSLGASGMGAYLGAVFSRSASYSVLYGSLGLIPIFLFWIYLMWLVILFGLEIASSLQMVGMRMDQRFRERSTLPPVVDSTLIVPVMQAISHRFIDGRTTELADLIETTRVNERALEIMLEALIENGFLHEVEKGDRTTYTLARPPGKISTDELLTLGQKLTGDVGEKDSPVWTLMNKIREAQLKVARQTTLDQL